MGVYDSVMVGCPKCGELSEFQTKGGECLMRSFTLEDAPDDVLSDVNRHAPNTCYKCGTKFKIRFLYGALQVIAAEVYNVLRGKPPHTEL